MWFGKTAFPSVNTTLITTRVQRRGGRLFSQDTSLFFAKHRLQVSSDHGFQFGVPSRAIVE